MFGTFVVEAGRCFKNIGLSFYPNIGLTVCIRDFDNLNLVMVVWFQALSNNKWCPNGTKIVAQNQSDIKIIISLHLHLKSKTLDDFVSICRIQKQILIPDQYTWKGNPIK